MIQLLLFTLTSFLIGGVGSVLLMKRNAAASNWGTCFGLLGSFGTLGMGLSALWNGGIFTGHLSVPFPFLALNIRVDMLSGIFLTVIGVIAILATIYGRGYMEHYFDTYRVGAFYSFYNFFIASMALVVIANQALFFLIAWELMALTSYFLVVFDHKEEENIRAGFLYFIMTHIATVFIVAMFLLLYRATGSLDFDVYRAQASLLSPTLQGILIVLALLGFGTKAGIIPLHVWLPSAHPAAPSHVSALMSGVMIKTGIYMLMRVCFDFFLHTPEWVGIVVLVLGITSSVLGVLYALGEHDIKRLLAYHSIENIGIILLGLGGALLFRSLGENALALLSFAAALFHTVNHAIFKSLLFMSAGAVVATTHTRNMERYGGLIKRMPHAAFFFLVGSIAISGIIPFNGFVSEWVTFQSLIGGIHSVAASAQVVFVMGIAALALTGGLAAACFVKAFGITFLARPRSAEASEAEEGGVGMSVAMAMLSLAALLLGIFGGRAAQLFTAIALTMPTFSTVVPVFSAHDGVMSVHSSFGVLNMPMLFLLLCGALLLTWLMVHMVSKKQAVTMGETWDCGFPLTPRMEMTSTAFARSIVTIFGGVLKPAIHIEQETYPAAKPYFLKRLTVTMHVDDLYRKYAYEPFARAVERCAQQAKKLQGGSTHAYLLYMLVVLLLLIVWVLH